MCGDFTLSICVATQLQLFFYCRRAHAAAVKKAERTGAQCAAEVWTFPPPAPTARADVNHWPLYAVQVLNAQLRRSAERFGSTQRPVSGKLWQLWGLLAEPRPVSDSYERPGLVAAPCQLSDGIYSSFKPGGCRTVWPDAHLAPQRELRLARWCMHLPGCS